MLKYIGKGKFIPGLPAKDLTNAELKALGKSKEELIATGLWEEFTPAKHRKQPYEDKMIKGELP